MSRSLKKGPYVHFKLNRKVEKNIQDNKKTVIKTWSRASMITPDFVGKDYIIECKGRANESFPIRWKLFKLWLTKNNIGKTLYKPQNQKEVDRTVDLIKQQRKY